MRIVAAAAVSLEILLCMISDASSVYLYPPTGVLPGAESILDVVAGRRWIKCACEAYLAALERRGAILTYLHENKVVTVAQIIHSVLAPLSVGDEHVGSARLDDVQLVRAISLREHDRVACKAPVLPPPKYLL